MDLSRNGVTAVLLAPHERLVACLPVWTVGWGGVNAFEVGSEVCVLAHRRPCGCSSSPPSPISL